jgi:hypothetical protein
MPIPFGIFADTGLPLDPIDAGIVRTLCQDTHEPVDQDILQAKADASEAHFGTVGDVDPNVLSEAGWGVLFGPSVDQRIKDALRPLLDHRKAQVGDENLFKVFEGDSGFLPGDTAREWLKRRNVRNDVVDPLLGIPFYLLIVAAPDEIPFEFQYALDVNWGAGRLWFTTADEFRQYADSVVQYETMQVLPTSRQTAIFATCHDFDAATQMFSSQVAQPLADQSAPRGPIGRNQKFALQSFIGDTATKDSLRNIFSGSPALLFSGTHGIRFRPDDPHQETSQGAIICQDWPGFGSITPDHFFDASDVPANAKVLGMIHVLFACYGGGYPQYDNFDRLNNAPKMIAPKPMIGRLPQALLAHPNGGALAVLGHVERAWAFSFHSDKGGPQTQGFRNVLGRILSGDRLGQATDQFNQRWAALSTDLADTLNQITTLGLKVPDRTLLNQWIARDDARNYIVIGDPAVRLRTEDMPHAVSNDTR